MLLLIALTLKGAIAISPTPPPPTPTTGGGGGGTYSPSTKSIYKEKYAHDYKSEEERIRKEGLEKIKIEDSELIAIVELTLKNFII